MKVEVRERVSSQSLVGSVHRFGAKGVLYEVVRPVDDSSVMIRVIETGELTAYPIVDILQDPIE
ncbi:MAG TPA: DUF5397 family protein [Candidatus Paceibacterota bacterium]